MAQVLGANTAFDMLDPFDGQDFLLSVIVGVSTSTAFETQNSSTGGRWQIQGVGFGAFVQGLPTVGTITGLTYSVLGAPVVAFSGTSEPIANFIQALANNNVAQVVADMCVGNDFISGSTQGDFLDGFGGINTMFGNAGDDRIFTSNAGELVDGGDGVDQVALDRFFIPGGLDLDLTAATTASGVTLSDGSIIRNVERFDIRTGVGPDTFRLSHLLVGSNSIFADDGEDTFIADLSAATESITLSLAFSGEGLELSAAAFALRLVRLEKFEIVFGAGGDFVQGLTEGPDFFDGGAGNDFLNGAGGNDIIHGGLGNDNLVGDAGEDILDGGEGPDTIFGGVGVDVATGGGGDDAIDGGVGADTMVGGAGADTYAVDDVFDVIIELPNEGIDSVQSSVTWFQPDNMENLTLIGGDSINGAGNALANVIIGNSGANQLFGFDGNDTLNSGGGAGDQLFGGRGDDIYIVSGATFTFEAQADWGTDLVQSFATFTLGANLDNLTLMVGAGAINGTGNGLANRITGNLASNTLYGLAGNDILNGGGGADKMFGGVGDDLYIVDNAADIAFEAQTTWGADTVQTSVSYQLGQNIDNLILQAGAGALTGRGNLLANTITGNQSANTLFGFAGNDRLDGGFGADQLYGGEGDDTYIVDNVSDVVAESSAAWGIDAILASVSYFLSSNIEHLTLTGSANINGSGNNLSNNITGNSGTNTLFGQLGDDVLDGGDGADLLYGGEGNDTYIVDNAGDVGFEASAAWGIDVVLASVNHTLGTNLDNLSLTGSAAINGTGNTLANIIAGNNGANALFGLGGADTLNGGAGNDTLDGGGGDDKFVFAPGSGNDTVNGFVAGGVEDSLDLSAYDGTGTTWTITQFGTDTIFAFSNGDQITLTNVTATQLVQTDPFGYG